jgi:hypothetical protein
MNALIKISKNAVEEEEEEDPKTKPCSCGCEVIGGSCEKGLRIDNEEEYWEEEVEYVVKTWIFKKSTNTIDYAGLFEVDCVKCWTTEEEARQAFTWAIETGEMTAVLLVRNTSSWRNEDRDTIIDEWEDNINEE